MADYTYYRKITVDNTKVDETDSDFAVLLNLTASGSGTLTDLKTVANSGHIENTDATGGASGAYTVPADLTFRTTADRTEAGASLDFEIEYYDAATGDFIAWVQSGVIVDTDVDIYMVYGNSGVTTSQEDVTGTWDANFKGVWHLGEASGTLYDSTSNNNDGTGQNTPTYSVAGPIGNCLDFDAAASEYVSIVDSAELRYSSGDWTIEAWVCHDASIGSGFAGVITKWGAQDYYLAVDSNDDYVLLFNGHTAGTPAAAALDTWYYLAVAVDDTGSDQDCDFFLNSVLAQEYSKGSSAFLSGADEFAIAAKSGGTEFFAGKIDEVRISDIARSAGYVATCYNNQFSPSTFYSVGSERGAGIYPAGIASAEALGTPALTITLQPTGIASAEAIGPPGVYVWGTEAGTRWGDGALWGDSTLWGDSPGWGSGKKWGTGVLWGQSLLPYPRGNYINLEIRTAEGTSYTSKAIDTAWRIESVLAQRISRAYFTFRTTSRSGINDHDEVIVTDQGQARLFGGFVESFEARPDGVEIEYDVVCVDYSWLLDHPNQLITKVYEDETSDQDIIVEIMEKYCPEIGTDDVEEIEEDLTREYYENMTPRQIIDALCKRTGATWYVDYGGAGDYKASLHYFVPEAIFWSGVTMEFEDGIHLDPPPYPYGSLVKRREHGIATEVTVEGRPSYVEVFEATIAIAEEDSDDPDLAAKKRIKLPYKLKPLNGEIRPQIWAYDGSDYLWQKVGYGGTQDGLGDIDSDEHQVLWYNDDKYLEFYTAPGLDGSNYGVKYSACELRPTEGVATDSTGETKYGRVLKTRVHDETIHDTETAQLVAETLLDRWKAGQDTISCVVWNHGLRAGGTIHLKNVLLGIDDVFIIQRVVGRGIGGDLWEYELELGKYIPDAVDTLRDISADKANRDELEKGVGKPPVIGQIMFSLPGTVTAGAGIADVPYYICAVNNLQILGCQLTCKIAPSGGDLVITIARYISDPDSEYYGHWLGVYNYGEWPTIADGETIGTDGVLSTLGGRPWLREGDMLRLGIESGYGADGLTVSVKVRQ